jgi:hypothetical protein
VARRLPRPLVGGRDAYRRRTFRSADAAGPLGGGLAGAFQTARDATVHRRVVRGRSLARPRRRSSSGFASPCARVAMHVGAAPRADCRSSKAPPRREPRPGVHPPTSNTSPWQARSRRVRVLTRPAPDVGRMFPRAADPGLAVPAPSPRSAPTRPPKIKLGGGGGSCNIRTIGAHRVDDPARSGARWCATSTSHRHRPPTEEPARAPGGRRRRESRRAGPLRHPDGPRGCAPLAGHDVETADATGVRPARRAPARQHPRAAQPTPSRRGARRPAPRPRLEFGPDELKRTFPCALNALFSRARARRSAGRAPRAPAQTTSRRSRRVGRCAAGALRDVPGESTSRWSLPAAVPALPPTPRRAWRR